LYRMEVMYKTTYVCRSVHPYTRESLDIEVGFTHRAKDVVRAVNQFK
jgi:hypothetical protein